MSDAKSLYKKFCEKERQLPLFFQYGWLESIYEGQEWDVVVELRGETVVGVLPFVLNKKKGFTLINPEFLSPYQGVWINYPSDQKYASKLGFEKEVISSLISGIPKVDSFKQNFLPSFTNWLPFFWKGYLQTTRYTYIIRDISDESRVFDQFRENIRREIRKAERILTVSTIDDIELLYNMKQEVYNEKGDQYHIPKTRLKRVYEYCKKKEQGELMVAKDAEGNIHSVILWVWDNGSAYYLHGVTASKFKTTGSMSLLLWEAIKRARQKTKSFNFEGSMVESIERYFRGFGGEQTPYFEISKTDSKLLKVLKYT